MTIRLFQIHQGWFVDWTRSPYRRAITDTTGSPVVRTKFPVDESPAIVVAAFRKLHPDHNVIIHGQYFPAQRSAA